MHCRHLFIGTYQAFYGYNGNDTYYDFKEISIPSVVVTTKLPELVSSISPDFITIYNQAEHAEILNLDKVSGMGYRKALEFLIKDFL